MTDTAYQVSSKSEQGPREQTERRGGDGSVARAGSQGEREKERVTPGWRGMERTGGGDGQQERDLDAHAIAKVVAEEVDVDAFEKVELLVHGAPLDVDAVVLQLLCNVDVRACMRA